MDRKMKRQRELTKVKEEDRGWQKQAKRLE